MENFFCSRDFGIGMVSGILSGLLVSIFIWTLRFYSKRKGIIKPTELVDNPERIKITNVGKIDVEGFEVNGQVSYSENGYRKRHHIKIDGLLNCYSPTVLTKNQNREFRIDLMGCIPDHNFNNFQQFRNQVDNGKIIIHVKYFGKYTGTLKTTSEEFL